MTYFSTAPPADHPPPAPPALPVLPAAYCVPRGGLRARTHQAILGVLLLWILLPVLFAWMFFCLMFASFIPRILGGAGWLHSLNVLAILVPILLTVQGLRLLWRLNEGFHARVRRGLMAFYLTGILLGGIFILNIPALDRFPSLLLLLIAGALLALSMSPERPVSAEPEPLADPS